MTLSVCAAKTALFLHSNSGKIEVCQSHLGQQAHVRCDFNLEALSHNSPTLHKTGTRAVVPI